ncbi:hypothetical protein GT348_02140 [Aristophania vespae]|uniref:Uncharacterized protein n=1 Tax=Aristophania vespae TaxID=2697033 RepID=A0A6P1NFK8_9PROT|nr:hypothetical protein [Aristophania vespae]QHI95234.1 hypothetical protein GT348_02140 [Aristophania vespae]UMM64478.1 hypothetical protein DM15PD_14930 [Aristophania vespae]
MRYLSKSKICKTFLALTLITGAGNLASPLMAKTVHHRHKAHSKPVLLTAQPGTKLDKIARSLNKDILEDAAAHNDVPVILIGSAPLSQHKNDKGLFVQIQSARLCGSAGCTTSVYLHRGPQWVPVLDAVNGDIAVLSTRHKGMYDLIIDKNDKWIWNGQTYQDTLPEK